MAKPKVATTSLAGCFGFSGDDVEKRAEGLSKKVLDDATVQEKIEELRLINKVCRQKIAEKKAR